MHTPYELRFKYPHDFEVIYTFLDEKNGGRKSGPPCQGYRSDFWCPHLNGKENQVFQIFPEFEDKEGNVILSSDERVLKSGKARMWIMNAKMRQFHSENISTGMEGYLMEGLNKVAKCEIVKIVGLFTNPKQ